MKLLANPYLLALGVSLISYLVIWGLKLIFTVPIGRYVGHAKNKWDDLVVFTVGKTSQIFMIVTALYIGFKFSAHLPDKWTYYSNRIYFILTMWQVAVWAHHLLEHWIRSTIHKRTLHNPAAASSISLIQLLARLVFFTFIFLFTLSNLGIKITTIIAGLGVGGIAVALALQKILGDLFSSLSIVLDKPFMVGDFIAVDQYLGEVEKIGLKTTRLKSLSGEQIIFSNSDLLATRIRNYKRMHERRVVFNLHFHHQIKTDQLKTVISQISNIIPSKNLVRFERSHFLRMNQSSLEVETVYWVLSDDYDLYLGIHQGILFDLKRALEDQGILLAYPTQTLQMVPVEVLMRTDQNTPSRSDLPLNSIVS